MKKQGPNSKWFFVGLLMSLVIATLLFIRARALSFIPVISGVYCFYYILSDRMIRKGIKHIEDKYANTQPPF